MDQVDELLAEMSRRDLRYYGLRGFDNRDALALVEQVVAGRYDDDGAKTERLLSLTARQLDERTLTGELEKVRRCPLRRTAA